MKKNPLIILLLITEVVYKAVQNVEVHIKKAPSDVKLNLAMELVNSGVELIAQFKELSEEEKAKEKAGFIAMIQGAVGIFNARGDFTHSFEIKEVSEPEKPRGKAKKNNDLPKIDQV